MAIIIIFTIKPTTKTVLKMVKKPGQLRKLLHVDTCAESKNWKLMDKNYYFLIPFYKADIFFSFFSRHGHNIIIIATCWLSRNPCNLSQHKSTGCNTSWTEKNCHDWWPTKETAIFLLLWSLREEIGFNFQHASCYIIAADF